MVVSVLFSLKMATTLLLCSFKIFDFTRPPHTSRALRSFGGRPTLTQHSHHGSLVCSWVWPDRRRMLITRDPAAKGGHSSKVLVRKPGSSVRTATTGGSSHLTGQWALRTESGGGGPAGDGTYFRTWKRPGVTDAGLTIPAPLMVPR